MSISVSKLRGYTVELTNYFSCYLVFSLAESSKDVDVR